LKDDVGERLRSVGQEYGTTTGRPRRCGWLDAVPVKYSVRLSGVTELVVTKLDVLSGIDPVKICVHYKCEEKIVDYIPASLKLFERCEPVYEEMQGLPDSVDWHKVALGGYDALPEQAKAYLGRIEELVKVPIRLVSVGPERRDTIVIED